MKRRIAGICSLLLYIAVLVALLYLQKNRIEETITGIAANLLTLILVLPTICLFVFWFKKEEMDRGLNDQKSQTNSTMCSMDFDLIREQFVTYMTQEALSEREIEVAWLIYRGYTNMQVAEELYISVTTVKKHATHIYEKLKITGRKELKKINLLE